MSIKDLVLVSDFYLSGYEFTSREVHTLSPDSHKVSISTALSRMHDQGFLGKRLEYPETAGSRIIAHFWKLDSPPAYTPAPKPSPDTDPMRTLWLSKTWVPTPTSSEDTPRWH
jgi:hypothetical protein